MQNISHANHSQLICGSPLWDNSVLWWTTTPQLTDCFRRTILPTISPIVMLLLTPFDFRYFYSKPNPQSIPWRSRNVSSALLSLIYIAISFTHLLRSVTSDVYFWNTVYEPSVDFIGLSMAYFLQTIYRRNGRRISIALQVFWLLKTLESIIRLYFEHRFSDNNHNINEKRLHFHYLIVYSVYISLSVVLFFLSNICDEVSNYRPPVVRAGSFCPLENESAFSRIMFSWVFTFLRKGFNKKIEFKDLKAICHSIKAKYVSKLYLKFDLQYNGKTKHKRLLPVLWSLCYKSVLFSHLILAINISARYIQPYILDNILSFIADGKAFQWHGLLFAVGFSTFSIISNISFQHMHAIMENSAIRCKSALIAQVYKKIFRLSPQSREQYTSGAIITLMSVDCNEVFLFLKMSLNLSFVPISVSIGLYLLWQYLGFASLGLVVVMLIVIPFNVLMGRRLDLMQKKQMSFKSKRMTKISEILNSIKIIKLNAWELPFIQRVGQLRDAELKAQRKMAIIYAFIVLVWIMAPMLSAGACFVTYALLDWTHFNAKTILVSLSILNILKYPMANIPQVFSRLIRAIVSMKRLSKFLSAEELDEHSIVRNKSNNKLSVCMETASFSYGLEATPVLKDLSIDIRKGQLIGVVGEVGAGKSSLLSAIIGDLYKIKGNIKVNGSIGFVPQIPWIQNKSFKDNIVFMAEEDDNRYQEILAACALLPDLRVLPSGDRTEIGEKGINLSGGQKQRVSLARAVFQNCDIYLMDDPLSSVDAHVGQHLFREVIGPKGLLRNKTRILCSHNSLYLQNCDQIYVLRDGEVVGHGIYNELSALGLIPQTEASDKPSIDEIDNQLVFMKSKHLFQNSLKNNSFESTLRQESNESTSDEITVMLCDASEPSETVITTEEEVFHLGSVQWKDYGRYISSVGIIAFIAIVMFKFGSNGIEVSLNYWISFWTNSENNTIFDKNDQIFKFSIYGSFLVLDAFLILLANIVLFVNTIRASKALHSRALYGVMRSPLSYFDWTPIGRILNRFSRDITSVDESIPDFIISLIDIITIFTILYALVAYKLTYLSLGLLAIISLFYLIYKFYSQTSRQMRRMESMSNSPVQSHFCESIAGTDSIRAYDVLPKFIKNSNQMIDLSLNCYYHRISLNFWLRVWSQIIGTLITLIVSLYIVLHKSEITVGLGGLLLVYCLEAVDGIAYTIRIMADLETDMISVERIREFCDLRPESDWNSSDDNKPPKDWPNSGSIEYQCYSTTYRSGLKPVLKDISFKIICGERVAIVGRTGAGKSSLALSLFRIIEGIGGRILIDGLDIASIGLHDLRSRLTIIPQECILFGDSLRTNLDPLGDYEDNQLWTVIEDCNLTDFVNSLPQKLDFKLSESGDNLSAGQRQLICLARGLLRKNKIIVLDEALSSCDLETDEIVQKVIKEKLNDCTVMSIAHRLNAVVDYDRVLVFEFGSLVENDCPKSLLLNENSFFYKLCKESQIV